ncbi:hypothetical protein HRF69_13225 [Bacillus circulans]|uniref:hypothetical protein n=1 Tax=Niallia circulans TaxID=1397 RepID=UPI001561902C|nr:hypothetical protein [Niallia circulans]NRG28080.1 hypothetical protein [Niallia circulans]UQZ74628.1 hypothetical protein C2I17_08645 [Niallia circulans]
MKIFSLSYFVVTRKIDLNMEIIEEEKSLDLWSDRVTSAEQTFHLHTIHDISFKPSSNQYKMLYLHTNRGVYSFVIKDNPEEMIRLIRRQIADYL